MIITYAGISQQLIHTIQVFYRRIDLYLKLRHGSLMWRHHLAPCPVNHPATSSYSWTTRMLFGVTYVHELQVLENSRRHFRGFNSCSV